MEPVSGGDKSVERDDFVASLGEQSSSSGATDTSSSSSSEFEEGTASPLPNKRARITSRKRVIQQFGSPRCYFGTTWFSTGE
ncbi:uncharacterized protein LOC142977348 isoform X2 [Anticarsia gemmatalis]|uniref:uncharacterized protein LOC142977348 isoform X2 n=1 Tax=Anticarsia gemmatalis TaxID=129554 RepID=UPI003F7598E5